LKRHHITLVICLIAILLTSCTAQALSVPVAKVGLFTMGQQPFATRTPFQPILPTLTNCCADNTSAKIKKVKAKQPVPIPSILQTSKPPGSVTPAIPNMITPSPILETTPIISDIQFKDQMTILVLGSDKRPEDPSFRTDAILLVKIWPQQGSVDVLSIPRDLYLEIPGWGYNRINVAQELGGIGLFSEVLDDNFGIRPDHYVMVNFQGFVDLVNSLNGIDVNTPDTLVDQCDLPQADWNGTCSVGPGEIHMDGATALWYVRARYTTSDFDRTRRQQEVLYAIFNRLLALDAVHHAPDLFDLYRKNVETDLSLEDFLPLVGILPAIAQPNHIHSYFIGPNETWDYISPEGAWVQLPDLPAIQAMVQDAFSSP